MAVAVSIGACLAFYFMDLLLSVIPASGLVSLLLLMATALLLGGLVWLYCRSLLVGAGAFLIFALPLTAVYLIKPILFKALFADFLYAINPFSGQTGFSYGYLDLGGVVFFLTVIALFAFLTVQSLESRRRA